MRLLLALGLALASVSTQQAPQTPTAQRPGDVVPATAAAATRTGVVRGRVLASNGRPLRRANVSLAMESGASRRLTTGIDGRFEFKELAADSYRLTASKPGYLVMEYGQQRAFERGKILALASGATIEGIDLRLIPAGAVSGRIVDENGDPIEGAGVQLLQRRFSGGRAALTPVLGATPLLTNDVGVYRIFGVPPGEYLVLCVPSPTTQANTAPGLPGYAPTYYPGTVSASAAQWVPVGLSQEVAGVDFSVTPTPTARIAGVLLRSNGSPSLLAINLTLSQRTSVLPLRMTVNPAADGSFEFRHVPPGDYILQASAQEGETYSQHLLVDGRDRIDLTIRTAPASTVAGQVTFEGARPVIGANSVVASAILVDADVAALGPSNAAVTASGTFQFLGLSGSRIFRIQRAPPGWTLKSVQVNGTDVTDTPLPFGSPQQSLGGLQIVLTNRGPSIRGSVTDSRGQPITDYAVVVFALDRDRWGEGSRFLELARPGRDNSFSVVDLPPAEYYVVALDRVQGTEAGGEWQDPEFLESIASRATRVTLGDGQQLTVTPRLIVR